MCYNKIGLGVTTLNKPKFSNEKITDFKVTIYC